MIRQALADFWEQRLALAAAVVVVLMFFGMLGLAFEFYDVARNGGHLFNPKMPAQPIDAASGEWQHWLFAGLFGLLALLLSPIALLGVLLAFILIIKCIVMILFSMISTIFVRKS